MAKNKEITAEEIQETYGGASDAPQDEGENLVKLEDE
jgi:hypothetical protein